MTVRLATGATIYAIGMALTVFAGATAYRVSFLIVSYVILGGDVVAGCEKHFKGACI